MEDDVVVLDGVGEKRLREDDGEGVFSAPAAKAPRIDEDVDVPGSADHVDDAAPAAGAGEAAVDVIAPKARRGGRQSKTLHQVHKELAWVAVGPEAEAKFAQKERWVSCTACKVNIKCETTLTNATKHASSASHLRMVSEAATQCKLPLADAATAGQVHRELRVGLRAAFTASVSSLVPKSLMGVLYGPSHLEAANLLHRHSMTIGAAGTVDRDVALALEQHVKDIAAAVKDQFGALIVDGASLPDLFEGTVKPLAVMFSMSRHGPPLGLGYVKNTTGTAKEAAEEIRRLLAKFGINEDNVVCLVGDNVAFNDVLAEDLGVLRMKCIPHSLALVLKAVTNAFPAWEVMTAKLGATLSAGGGHKRSVALEAKGVKPHAITGYPNRWGSTLEVAKTLLDMNPVAEDGDLPITIVQGQVLSWVASTGDADEDGSTRLGQVQAAFHDDHLNANMLQLGLVIEMAGDLGRLITVAGGDTWVAQDTPIAVFTALRERLERVVTGADVDLDMIIGDVAERSPLEYLQAEVDAVRGDLRARMRAAAAAALKAFDKHVQPALRMVKHRFMYDHHHIPPPLPADLPPTADERRECLRRLLGFNKESSATTIMGEYTAYCAAWPALSAADKALPAAEFWHSKKDIWPTLAKVASWWCEVPTSSVAVERMFALMRGFVRSNRASMKESTFEAEWLFRVNRRLVDERLAKALRAASTMPAGAR
jgi:hypothetical protein